MTEEPQSNMQRHIIMFKVCKNLQINMWWYNNFREIASDSSLFRHVGISIGKI